MFSADDIDFSDSYNVGSDQRKSVELPFNSIFLGGCMLLFCILGLVALYVQCWELIKTLKTQQRRHDDDPSNMNGMENHMRAYYKKSFEEVSTELHGLRTLQKEVATQLDQLKVAMQEIQATAEAAAAFKPLQQPDPSDNNDNSTTETMDKKDR